MELMRSLASLSDMVRLRLLRLIEREELGVGELSKVLQLPQSTVSRHLKILHDNGWIALRTEGPASLYRMDDAALGANALALWNVVNKQLDSGPTLAEDEHRLTMVLAQRRSDSSTFFGRIVGEWDRLRSELFGESFTSSTIPMRAPCRAAPLICWILRKAHPYSSMPNKSRMRMGKRRAASMVERPARRPRMWVDRMSRIMVLRSRLL